MDLGSGLSTKASVDLGSGLSKGIWPGEWGYSHSSKKDLNLQER